MLCTRLEKRSETLARLINGNGGRLRKKGGNDLTAKAYIQLGLSVIVSSCSMASYWGIVHTMVRAPSAISAVKTSSYVRSGNTTEDREKREELERET